MEHSSATNTHNKQKYARASLGRPRVGADAGHPHPDPRTWVNMLKRGTCMFHFEMSLGTGGTLASSPGAGYFSTHCRNASASGPGFVRCQVPSRCRRPPCGAARRFAWRPCWAAAEASSRQMNNVRNQLTAMVDLFLLTNMGQSILPVQPLPDPRDSHFTIEEVLTGQSGRRA